MEYEIFPRAPIAEAILEIIANLPETVVVEDLVQFPQEIRNRFSRTVKKMELKSAFKLAENVTVLPSHERIIGYQLHSDEDKKVIQSRLDGFAFSKLRPYESWEKFRTEAREIWTNYCAITKPLKIVRISLRYVNRIEIPTQIKDFNEYILTNPNIAPGLPQGVSEFFMRLEIPEPSINGGAIVTLTIDNVKSPEILPLIFDIDVIRQQNYEKDMEKIWDDFEELHNFKNDIFFKSLTEKAKELFR